MFLDEVGISRLGAEPQDGSTEYKLHLLLRPRRQFTWSSTGSLISGSQHSKPYELSRPSTYSDDHLPPARPILAPSNRTRQTRLQQLTTQLLWRLQQSSPFLSSSTANLVLPLLPEATPQLGVPARQPKVIPGLEESQGALYEIGVSDDGTFVGLTEDELNESLTNLEAMAASLGCVVEILRRVMVGECEWSEPGIIDAATNHHVENLWVVEALVRPELDLLNSNQNSGGPTKGYAVSAPVDIKEEATHSDIEQLRVSLTGMSTAGKSSLLGTLTTSTLDNGRGKSRLSLLKHRHEIASGITSSVAQELIGYPQRVSSVLNFADPQQPAYVINYASNNVSSWNDIHGLASRLVFLSDSPGLPRFSKSTIRTLVAWNPHWTVLCVAADHEEGTTGNPGATTSSREIFGRSTGAGRAGSERMDDEPDLSIAHIELCLKLGLPLVVAITKLDLATKAGLRQTLAKVLSSLKAHDRRPLMLGMPAQPSGGQRSWGSDDVGVDLRYITASDEAEVHHIVATLENHYEHVVPIVLTSALTGAGIGKLHALLRSLPVPNNCLQTVRANIGDGSGQIGAQCDIETVFRIDEVFSIPPSKVYSSSDGGLHNADKGAVLCGYTSSGTITIGDQLMLGPFFEDFAEGESPRDSDLLSRSILKRHGRSLSGPSASARSTSKDLSKSLSSAPTKAPLNRNPPTKPCGKSFNIVRVVSIRNLRLPVHSLLADQVGTIGVELSYQSDVSLRRARKGMVLIKSATPRLAYRSFTATFLSLEFASTASPPLILGGHAVAYINNIRAAVKVTSVALSEDEDNSGASSPTELFDFDSDGHAEEQQRRKIQITFKFISSVEWMQVGDQVLIIPTASATGPVTGPVGTFGWLSGFVGRICGCIT